MLIHSPRSIFARHSLAIYLLVALVTAPATVEARPARVELTTVTQAAFSRQVVVNGRLSLTRAQLVSSRLDGVVRDIGVEPGDLVTADSVLLRLNTPDADDKAVQLQLDIAFDQSRLRELDKVITLESASLDIARQQARLLKDQSNRSVQLGSNVSADARDAALSNSLNAQLQVINREANLVRLEEQQRQVQLSLQKSQSELKALNRDRRSQVVTSGVAGYISSLDIQPGETVSSDQVLVHVLPLTSLVAEIALVPASVKQIRQGQTFQVIIENKAYAATFHSALPTLDSRSGLQTVFLEFTDPAKVPFVLNLPLQVRVSQTSDDSVLMIPQDAIVPKGERAFVFIADDNIARETEVTLGAVSGNMVTVLDGLRSGDQVVVRGNETLTDGQEITTGGGRESGSRQKPGGQASGQPSDKSGN